MASSTGEEEKAFRSTGGVVGAGATAAGAGAAGGSSGLSRSGESFSGIVESPSFLNRNAAATASASAATNANARSGAKASKPVAERKAAGDGKAGDDDDGLEEDDDDEEEDEDVEPRLKYQRVSARLPAILGSSDTARCLCVHDKFLVMGTFNGCVHVLDLNGTHGCLSLAPSPSLFGLPFSPCCASRMSARVFRVFALSFFRKP